MTRILISALQQILNLHQGSDALVKAMLGDMAGGSIASMCRLRARQPFFNISGSEK
jgi:hypothetical protein